MQARVFQVVRSAACVALLGSALGVVGGLGLDLTGSGVASAATPAPIITSFTPTSGSTLGGTSVTITGSYLNGTTSVKFGTTAATTFTVTGTTKIVAKTKAHAAGTVKIKVTTSCGSATSSTYYKFVVPASPTITSFTPTSGSTVGGTSVTITGTNFTSTTSVKFGTTAATTFTVTGTTKIVAKTKTHAAGTFKIKVTTPPGTATSSTYCKFVAPPTITSFTPTSGSTAGGTSVTITGTNLNGATAVKFGTTAATTFAITGTT